RRPFDMKKYSLGSLNVVVSFCSNNEARVYLKIMRYFKKTLRDTNFKFIFTYRKSTTGICHTTNIFDLADFFLKIYMFDHNKNISIYSQTSSQRTSPQRISCYNGFKYWPLFLLIKNVCHNGFY